MQGVRVTAVQAYSAAEDAGISAGDVIVQLDGHPMTKAVQLQQTVQGLPAMSIHTVMLLRDGMRMKAHLRLTPPTSVMRPVVPPRQGPLDINTLKYVAIDPQTHAVTLIGRYDPAYATGPIPYADILKDVLANPYPSFSLDPTDQQHAEFRQMNRMISADIHRMYADPNYCNRWGQRLADMLMHDPSLPIDSRRFDRNCASALGLSGKELRRLFEAAEGKIKMPSSESFPLFAKLMRGLGLPDLGNAMDALGSGGDPYDLVHKMCHAMHLDSQYQALVSQMKARKLTYKRFMENAITLGMAAMCLRLGAPEAEIRSRVAQVRSGRQSSSIMTNYFGQQLGAFITKKAGAKMLDGFVMSPQLMSRLYDLPLPESNLDFTGVPADSYLGDALFRADYLLKTLCSNPDVRERIRGHLTHQEFLRQVALSEHYDLPVGSIVGVGDTLLPADVKMLVSPKGNVVEFEQARIKVVSWVKQLQGAARGGRAAAFIRSMVPKYGQILTAHYDDYAKVFPEWHTLSEVAKCVALARWAHSRNYHLVVDAATDRKVPLPRRIPGFWTAVFEVEGERASLTVTEEGGASFGRNQGEAWVEPKQDDTVASGLSRQLVASTLLAEQAANSALGGNLEGARELAEKSAQAMAGDIDLNMLPKLSDLPMPNQPATYATADAEIIKRAARCFDTMKAALGDLDRARAMEKRSPLQAAVLRRKALQTEEEARAKLKRLLAAASVVKATPSSAGAVASSLQNGTPLVSPSGTALSGTTSGSDTTTKPATKPVAPESWATKLAKMKAQLDQVDKRIASTRTVLLRLSATIQADRKQYEQWEQTASDGFDSCVNMAANVAIDFGAGAIAERYEKIHELAKKLPKKPASLIEKYRHLAALAKRMVQAKAAGDLDGLAKRENTTDAQMLETMRDGIGQIIGLLGLDKTVPGALWKYGSLAADLAYNLTELRIGFKNVTALEGNTEQQRKAVKKLAEQMRKLVERQKFLRTQIEQASEKGF